MKIDPSFEAIIHVFSRNIKLTLPEITALTDRLELMNFRKKQFLLQQDKICKGIFYLNGGFCKLSRIVNDVQTTIHFAGQNQFTTNIEGILFNHPSPYGIQAIEPVQAVFISKATIDWACDNLTEGNKLVAILWENYSLLKTKQIISHLKPSPLQRYKELVAEFPDIEQRVSQKTIASYLNITPQYLSMLKIKSKNGLNSAVAREKAKT